MPPTLKKLEGPIIAFGLSVFVCVRMSVSHFFETSEWCMLARDLKFNTPQPLYNTVVGVQDNFRVSYPIRVITRAKCLDI